MTGDVDGRAGGRAAGETAVIAWFRRFRAEVSADLRSSLRVMSPRSVARVMVCVTWAVLAPRLITVWVQDGPVGLLRAEAALEVASGLVISLLPFLPTARLQLMQALLMLVAPGLVFFQVLWSTTQVGRISFALVLTTLPVAAFVMWGRRLGVVATLTALVGAGVLGLLGLIAAPVALVLCATIADCGLMLGWALYTRERVDFDAVTGLANGQSLDRLLLRLLDEPGSASAACLLAVLDVDGLRHHNESLGHRAGDDLLREVGRTLTERLPPSAQLFHLGAGEFAAVLHGDRRDGVEQLENLRRAPAAGVSLCAGMTALVAPTTPARLLKAAEASLALAKEAGPDAIDPLLVDDFMVHELRDAIVDGRLTVLYQPIVDLVENTTVGCEALVRWDHPTRGRISPDDFIPLAERTGLIHDLGRFVLHRACTQAASAASAGLPLRHLSVNASALELRRPDYADLVLATVAETGLDPRHLVLEVTESSVAGQDPDVSAALSRLRAHGVRVAIDDFGTGYSSLSQLGNLPVDILKVDKSFIWADATPARDSVLTAIIALADAFGLTTISEGIETWDHLELLRRLGSTFGQGYLFGRPAAFADLELAAPGTGTQPATSADAATRN